MKLIRLSTYFTLILVMTSSISATNQNVVYTCNHPDLKCYVLEFCPKLEDKCSKFKGKIFSMPEYEANSIGKELCKCSEI